MTSSKIKLSAVQSGGRGVELESWDGREMPPSILKEVLIKDFRSIFIPILIDFWETNPVERPRN